MYRTCSKPTATGIVILLFALCLTSCTSQNLRVMDASSPSADTVLLIHGLARGASSMNTIGEALHADGYRLCYIDYPSTRYGPPELVRRVNTAIDQCLVPGSTVHAVTHSLGGVLLRAVVRERRDLVDGRVVMLAPPNGGSELGDVVERSGFLRAVLGPTAADLGTNPFSFPNRLGPANFDVGILAGDRSVHPLGSFILDGPNDGTVTQRSARLAGMRDFATVHRAHSFIMNAPEVVHETRAYLRSGCFSRQLESVSYNVMFDCADR